MNYIAHTEPQTVLSLFVVVAAVAVVDTAYVAVVVAAALLWLL